MAGTTPPPSPQKSSVRSARIRAPCLVAVAIVALSYVLPFAAMWMTGLKATAWETAPGPTSPAARRSVAARWRSPRRNHQRLRHVQRVGHELFAPASGDGTGRHAARHLCQAAEQNRAHPGWHSRAGRRLGDVPGPGFAGLLTLDILLYGFSLMLEFIALAVLRFREPECRAISRSRRLVRCDRYRHLFSAHAAFCFSIIRSEPLSKVLGNDELSFRNSGMILDRRGVVGVLSGQQPI